MKTHADKASNNKSQPDTNGSSQQQDVQFTDNRAEAVAQKKLKDMANSSQQAAQMKAYSDMANNSADVQQLKAFADVANNSHHVQQLKAYGQMADNNAGAIQRKGNPEEEPLQGKFEPVQKKENKTGLPDTLKSGIEHLSGMDISDVKVHYNSARPAQLQAHAYAQGTDIHVAPGQEKHLPHEAWHVVQQKQGKVKPTLQMKTGTAINDDAGLESEADVMGAKAGEIGRAGGGAQSPLQRKVAASGSAVVQMVPLNKKFDAGLKMAIVGETHGGIKKNIEEATWQEEKIDLKYEYAQFEVKDPSTQATKTMSPDPRPARLLYVVTSILEDCNTLLTQPDENGILRFPKKGPLDEAMIYILKQAEGVINGAEAAITDPEALKLGLKATLGNLSAAFAAWKAIYLASKGDGPRVLNKADILGVLRTFLPLKVQLEEQLGSGSTTLHAYSSNDYSLLRSNNMYQTILKIAESVGRTIYKVGNSHIDEMQKVLELKPTPSVDLLNSELYTAELLALMDIHKAEKRGHYKA